MTTSATATENYKQLEIRCIASEKRCQTLSENYNIINVQLIDTMDKLKFNKELEEKLRAELVKQAEEKEALIKELSVREVKVKICILKIVSINKEVVIFFALITNFRKKTDYSSMIL